MPVFASILINSNLGLKWKQTAEKENTYVTVYWILAALKGDI